jgi:hypothetical protein
MERSDAEGIWGLIAAVYGLHPERAAETAVAWVPALQEMDATLVMVIVDAWMHGKGPERMPTLVAFASEVRLLEERRRADAKPAAVRGTAQPLPLWYLGWKLLRDEGDMRRLPEQEGGYVQMGYDWPGQEIRKTTTVDGSVSTLVDVEILEGEEYEKLIERARQIEQQLPPVWVEPDPECIVCRDQGLVEIGWETRAVTFRGVTKAVRMGEQLAPCPKCERGRRHEFPLESVGPWGSDGFWRGRKYNIVRAGVVELAA